MARPQGDTPLDLPEGLTKWKKFCTVKSAHPLKIRAGFYAREEKSRALSPSFVFQCLSLKLLPSCLGTSKGPYPSPILSPEAKGITRSGSVGGPLLLAMPSTVGHTLHKWGLSSRIFFPSFFGEKKTKLHSKR
jgi:hypothetical protein